MSGSSRARSEAEDDKTRDGVSSNGERGVGFQLIPEELTSLIR